MSADIKSGSRLLLRTDGTVVPMIWPDRNSRLDAAYKAIGCDTVDVVRLRHLGEPEMVMIVDDNGAITDPPKPVNPIATELYHANCVPGTVWPIRGDVVVCPDGDFA